MRIFAIITYHIITLIVVGNQDVIWEQEKNLAKTTIGGPQDPHFDDIPPSMGNLRYGRSYLVTGPKFVNVWRRNQSCMFLLLYTNFRFTLGNVFKAPAQGVNDFGDNRRQGGNNRGRRNQRGGGYNRGGGWQGSQRNWNDIPICFVCGSDDGHWSYECIFRGDVNMANRCFRCKSFNHYTWECSKPFDRSSAFK